MFMTSTRKRECPHVGGGGCLKICRMSADSLSFKQKIYRDLSKDLQICDLHKCVTSKWFRITTNSIIRGSSFFFNIKPQAMFILVAQKTTSRPFLHSTGYSKLKAPVTFSWPLIFYAKKYFGLLNVASQLASNKPF